MNDGSLTCRRNPSRGTDSWKPAWHLARAAVWIDDKCLQKKPWQNSISPSFLKAGPSHAQSLRPGDSMWACPPFSPWPSLLPLNWLCSVWFMCCFVACEQLPSGSLTFGSWLGFAHRKLWQEVKGAVRKRAGASSPPPLCYGASLAEAVPIRAGM